MIIVRFFIILMPFMAAALFPVIVAAQGTAVGPITFEPFTNQRDAIELICAVTRDIRWVALYVAVAGILFLGFQMVAAASTGNRGKLEQYKKIIIWVVAGAAIIAGAMVIVRAVVQFAAELDNRTPPAVCLGL